MKLFLCFQGQCHFEGAYASFLSMYSILTTLIISIHLKKTITEHSYKLTPQLLGYYIAAIFSVSLIDAGIPLITNQYNFRGYDCHISILHRPNVGFGMRMGTRYIQIVLVIIVSTYNFFKVYFMNLIYIFRFLKSYITKGLPVCGQNIFECFRIPLFVCPSCLG